MPTADTQVTITEGLPTSDPWTISELDTNLKNLALARLVALGANQGMALRKQTAVLIEQTNQLDSLSATAKEMSTGTKTALVVDNAGKILITDPAIVSDLVGRDPTTLTSSEVDRLIQFTANLQKSSPPVNLGGRDYVSVTVDLGNPTNNVIQAPVQFVIGDPFVTGVANIQPFVCYIGKDSSGKLKYRMVDEKNINISISSVSALTNPDAKFVLDAYRLNSIIYRPIDFVGSLPATASPAALYRNALTGELTLINSLGKLPANGAEGFVLPANKDEIAYWFGQAALDRLKKTYQTFSTDGIKLPTEPDSVQWTYADSSFSGGGFTAYPPLRGDPTSSSIPVGTIVQDSVGDRLHLIYGRVGTNNKFIEIKYVGDPFVLNIGKDGLVNIRGQYTEVITRATQRTTEQQLFLNSLLQKQNYHFDAATNVLKAFNDLHNRQAGLL